MAYLSENDPASLPWRDFDVAVVVEATGRFRTRESAAAHLRAGVSRVVVSAPCKDADATIVLGVNEGDFDPARDRVISNASCTDQLPGPHDQSARGEFRGRAGVHHDSSRLHR